MEPTSELAQPNNPDIKELVKEPLVQQNIEKAVARFPFAVENNKNPLPDHSEMLESYFSRVTLNFMETAQGWATNLGRQLSHEDLTHMSDGLAASFDLVAGDPNVVFSLQENRQKQLWMENNLKSSGNNPSSLGGDSILAWKAAILFNFAYNGGLMERSVSTDKLIKSVPEDQRNQVVELYNQMVDLQPDEMKEKSYSFHVVKNDQGNYFWHRQDQ